MSVSFWPPYFEDRVQVDVDDPGYGYLRVHVDNEGDDRWQRGLPAGREVFTIAGRAVGALLRSLTEVAMREQPYAWHLQIPVAWLWPMSPADARGLLPSVMQAVVWAAAGTDRAERLLDDAPSVAEWPVCVRCEVDSVWSSANPRPNPYCEEHGHTVFGARPGNNGAVAYTAAREAAERGYRERLGARGVER